MIGLIWKILLSSTQIAKAPLLNKMVVAILTAHNHHTPPTDEGHCGCKKGALLLVRGSRLEAAVVTGTDAAEVGTDGGEALGFGRRWRRRPA